MRISILTGSQVANPPGERYVPNFISLPTVFKNKIRLRPHEQVRLQSKPHWLMDNRTNHTPSTSLWSIPTSKTNWSPKPWTTDPSTTKCFLCCGYKTHIEKDFLCLVCSGLGFAYELRLARDGKHGGPGENNTWTGMIGELVRGVSAVILWSLIARAISPQLLHQKNVIFYSLPVWIGKFLSPKIYTDSLKAVDKNHNIARDNKVHWLITETHSPITSKNVYNLKFKLKAVANLFNTDWQCFSWNETIRRLTWRRDPWR